MTQHRETPEERRRRQERTARAATAWQVGLRRPVTAPLSMLAVPAEGGEE